MILGYVVTALRDDLTRLYLARDLPSGGYTYWAGFASSAILYETVDAARTHMETEMRERRFLHGASGADYSRPKREVRILIQPLVLDEPVIAARHTFDLNAPEN